MISFSASSDPLYTSIKSTGKISGEVFYENISIEEGAVVEAQIGKRKSKN